MANFRNIKNPRVRAFSLLELSVVIAIISVVAVMGLEGVAAYVSYTAYQATQDRMKVIDAALLKYRYVHGRLPCPAPLAAPNGAITNAAYGSENCAGATVLTAGGISSFRLTGGGSGYSANGFIVPFTGGSGYGATGLAVLSGGTINSVRVLMGGYGYNAGNVLTGDLDAGGTPTAGAVSVTLASTRLASTDTFNISSGSAYFSSNPQSFCPIGVNVAGNTSGAIVLAYFNSSGTITEDVVINPGYGFGTGAQTFVEGGCVNPSANFASRPANPAVTAILAGGLPVRDLGLPLSYALDAYGSKFMYFVTGDLTAVATFRNASGNIQIRSGPLAEPCTGACRVDAPNAAYAFISVGKDQRGGFNQRGVVINNCIPSTQFNAAIDAQNCMFQNGLTTPIAVTIPQGVLYNSTFNNGTPGANYTDDLLNYRIKSEL